MKKKILGVALAIATAMGASAATAKTLRIATEGAYPPFNYVDENDEIKGFDVDIAKALCAEMKFDCEISTFAWDGMIPGLNAGKFDAIVASMSITPKRLKAVNFSSPYYVAGSVLVAAKDSDLVPTREGLAGKVIGVQRSSSYAALIAAKFPEAELREYDKNEEHNLDLIAGRVDAVMAQRLFMQRWLDTEDAADFEVKGKAFFDVEILGPGAGIAVRKADTELLALLNEALETIKTNGVYDEINDRYFPFSLKPGQ